MPTGNMFKRKSVNGAGRQDYEGGEETLDELGLSMREREKETKIALQIKESLTKVTVYPDTIWWERE